MAFEFQRSVLIDGEWVTRSADIYHIMARNQDPDHEATATGELDPNLSDPTPNIGILSRTVIETPLTRVILPASIRHKEMNDVLYVGEDFVQLHEIVDYGHLRHVATKSDFKGKIMAARIFGDPRNVHVSTSEHNPLLKRAVIHRARRSTIGSDEADLPPDIAVLTLSSRTLMFLWASQNHSGSVTFHQKTLRLPGGQSIIDRPGHHLAIDPKGRALAVAAREGLFVIYRTRTPEAWRKDMRNGYDGLPIIDEAIVPMEGRVMHMEFLSSGTQDEDHVVLVFIVVQEGKTKVLSYEWDLRDGLQYTASGRKRAFVDFEDRNPSLIIPLKHGAEFLLISDQHISIYKRVLSGPPEITLTRISAQMLAPLRPATSKHSPRWVQWDRALRNPDFDKEAFYVAREDGMVMYVEYGVHDHSSIEISKAGTWPYSIDTAFAFLAVDNSEFAHCYPDVLISGGVGSDGLICKIGAWPTEYMYTQGIHENRFSFLDSIPCWAPLMDMTVTKTSADRSLAGRHRIFVTNGKSPFGEISELRRGLKAVIDGSFQGMQGCTGLWVLDYGVTTFEHNGRATQQPYATFVFTLPPETIVIRATRVQKEGSEDHEGSATRESWEVVQVPSEDEEIEDSVIRAEETVTACMLNDDYAIQISRHEVRSLRRPALTVVSVYKPPSPLLGASTKSNISHIAWSYRASSHSNAVVELAPIHPDGAIESDPGKRLRHELAWDPTCVELLSVDDATFVFVGTIDAVIYLFKLVKGSLNIVFQANFGNNSNGKVPMLCESVVLLGTKDRRQLVCGTRDGHLVSILLQPDQNRYQSGSTNTNRIGSTAVHVHPCATDSSVAFMACGPEFCRISTSLSGSCAIDIDPIWLADHPITPTMYAQGPIVALDQLPFQSGSQSDGRDLGGLIFAVSGEEMVFAQLDYDVRWSGQNIHPAEQSKMVPRKIPTKASPMKMMYMEGTTRYMVVATMENKEVRAPPNGYRTVQSTLKFLRVDAPLKGVQEPEIKKEDGDSDSHANKLVAYEFSLEPYERVYTMVEWIIDSDQGKKYKLLVVGTGITKGPEEEDGRRLFFNAGGKSGVKLIKEIPHDRPVRCLAIYNNTYLIGVIGKTIRVWEFLSTTQKWPVRAEKQLPSMGVYMTISENFVYVSTANDSLICYEIVMSSVSMQLVQVLTDSRQRSSTHHLVCDVPHPSNTDNNNNDTAPPDSRIVLVADKTCSLTGLFHSTLPTAISATPTLFTAELPRSVIRLHRADIRPPWRRSYTSSPPPASPSSSSSSALPPPSPWPTSSPSPTGILADDILGACSDGTIYAFSLLTPPALHLLRLTQNILEAKRKRDPKLQYTPIKPRSSDLFRVLLNGAEGAQDALITARDVDPCIVLGGGAGDEGRAGTGGGGKARFLHVDGDLIARWRREGGAVVDLVRRGCEEAVAGLFVRFAREVFGSLSEGVGSADDEEVVFEMVGRWLDDILVHLL